MSILYELPEILRQARQEAELLLETAREKKEKAGTEERWKNSFFLGDNAALLVQGLTDGSLREKIDLIYIDPPFYSGADQGTRIELKSPIYDKKIAGRLWAYADSWKNDRKAYLEMIAVRLILMRETLKKTGSIFVHLDWHAVHEVKLLMDEIFGEENFINEIIWTYKSGGATKRHYARKHDTILFYSKTDQYKFRLQKEKSYNRGLKPYKFKGVEEFQDELGWYTIVNQKDVWQIDMVGRSSGERLNYATQKPEALLERIISAVTDEGDLTADFFCGSGTLAAAACRMNRNFLCADVSSLAVSNAMKRPLREGCACTLSFVGGSEDIAARTGKAGRRKKGKPQIRAEIADEKIRLLAYKAKAEEIPLKLSGGGQVSQIGEILRRDSLAFIDYWGIGTEDENGVFRPVKAVFREKNGLIADTLPAENFPADILPADGAPEEISRLIIFAADVTGNLIFTQPFEW